MMCLYVVDYVNAVRPTYIIANSVDEAKEECKNYGIVQRVEALPNDCAISDGVIKRIVEFGEVFLENRRARGR